MILDSFSLFGANAVILFVMAAAFFLAGRTRPGERYWRSWWTGNILLGIAIIGYMWVDLLPLLFRAILPNGLLVAGFGLRWRAAREFTGRPAPAAAVWFPAVAFAMLCIVPGVAGSPAAVYTSVNVILAMQAAATAFEFYQHGEHRLASRTGLVIAYGVMALSFAVRVGQGALSGSEIRHYLPIDEMLLMHLVVALFFTVASGSFALSIAYERDARRLQALAMEDSLTKLLNRGAFEAELRRLLAASDCGNFAVIAFDIDHFKLVNDRHGHAAGDLVLREFARVCRAALPVHASIARTGGEEFAAIVTQASQEDAVRLADAVRQGVRTLSFRFGEARLAVTVSVGVCHSANGIGDFDGLMRQADSALYAAKHRGRDRVEQARADADPEGPARPIGICAVPPKAARAG